MARYNQTPQVGDYVLVKETGRKMFVSMVVDDKVYCTPSLEDAFKDREDRTGQKRDDPEPLTIKSEIYLLSQVELTNAQG